MKQLRFSTPQEVRRSLAKVMNMVYNELLDPKRANTIILGCNAVLNSIRVDEQQRKIDELEAKVNGDDSGNLLAALNEAWEKRDSWEQ